MIFRVGLNKKQQIQCATWLEEGIDPKDIAKKFKTSPAIVLKFTKDKLDKANKLRKERESITKTLSAESLEKAKIVKEVLDAKPTFN